MTVAEIQPFHRPSRIIDAARFLMSSTYRESARERRLRARETEALKRAQNRTTAISFGVDMYLAEFSFLQPFSENGRYERTKFGNVTSIVDRHNHDKTVAEIEINPRTGESIRYTLVREVPGQKGTELRMTSNLEAEPALTVETRHKPDAGWTGLDLAKKHNARTLDLTLGIL